MAGIRGRLRIVGDFGVEVRVNRRCPACVVDHVADFAVVAQADSDDVVELYLGGPWSLNGPAQQHARMLKDTVDPKTPRFMAGHRVGYLV
jgi:hypothetical protein